MPAPSKAWVVVADSQVDADSPLDTTLITALRDDTVHLEEWLGKNYTAAIDHEHDDISSKKINMANISKTGGFELFDDFLGVGINTFNWALDGTTSISNTSTRRLSGVMVTSNAGGVTGGIHTTTKLQFSLGSSNTLTFETKFRSDAAYSPTELTMGFAEANMFSPTNSACFEITGTEGNWRARTSVGGVATTTDTGVPISLTAWHKLKIVATSTSVAFYVDDVLKATHTTNIPTGDMGVVLRTRRDVQTTTYYWDYVLAPSALRN